MKSTRVTALYLLVSFLTVNLSACVSVNGRRFYSGDPLPPEQVALIFIDDDFGLFLCSIEDKLFAIAHDDGSLAAQSGVNAVEVLPGRWSFRVGYYHATTAYLPLAGTVFPITAWSLTKRCLDVNIDAHGGHVYYISQWNPRVVDITRDEDYQGIKNGELVHRRVKKYFQEERSVIRVGLWQVSGKEYKVVRGDNLGEPVALPRP
jgi:hypothetical protein